MDSQQEISILKIDDMSINEIANKKLRGCQKGIKNQVIYDKQNYVNIVLLTNDMIIQHLVVSLQKENDIKFHQQQYSYYPQRDLPYFPASNEIILLFQKQKQDFGYNQEQLIDWIWIGWRNQSQVDFFTQFGIERENGLPKIFIGQDACIRRKFFFNDHYLSILQDQDLILAWFQENAFYGLIIPQTQQTQTHELINQIGMNETEDSNQIQLFSLEKNEKLIDLQVLSNNQILVLILNSNQQYYQLLSLQSVKTKQNKLTYQFQKINTQNSALRKFDFPIFKIHGIKVENELKIAAIVLNGQINKFSILTENPNIKESGFIQHINESNPLSENIKLKKINDGTSFAFFTGSYSTISYLFISHFQKFVTLPFIPCKAFKYMDSSLLLTTYDNHIYQVIIRPSLKIKHLVHLNQFQDKGIFKIQHIDFDDYMIKVLISWKGVALNNPLVRDPSQISQYRQSQIFYLTTDFTINSKISNEPLVIDQLNVKIQYFFQISSDLLCLISTNCLYFYNIQNQQLLKVKDANEASNQFENKISICQNEEVYKILRDKKQSQLINKQDLLFLQDLATNILEIPSYEKEKIISYSITKQNDEISPSFKQAICFITNFGWLYAFAYEIQTSKQIVVQSQLLSSNVVDQESCTQIISNASLQWHQDQHLIVSYEYKSKYYVKIVKITQSWNQDLQKVIIKTDIVQPDLKDQNSQQIHHFDQQIQDIIYDRERDCYKISDVFGKLVNQFKI